MLLCLIHWVRCRRMRVKILDYYSDWRSVGLKRRRLSVSSRRVKDKGKGGPHRDR